MKSKTWIEEAKAQIVANYDSVAKSYEGAFFYASSCKTALAAKLSVMYPNVTVTVHYNSSGAKHLSFAPVRVDLTNMSLDNIEKTLSMSTAFPMISDIVSFGRGYEAALDDEERAKRKKEEDEERKQERLMFMAHRLGRW